MFADCLECHNPLLEIPDISRGTVRCPCGALHYFVSSAKRGKLSRYFLLGSTLVNFILRETQEG